MLEHKLWSTRHNVATSLKSSQNAIIEITKHIETLQNKIDEKSQYIENLQNEINKKSQYIGNLENKINDISQSLEKTQRNMKLLETRTKKITIDFVTILGIFSSIIFSAFGGLELLKNILGNISNVNTGKLLVFSSLTAGIIIFMIFFLLNGISKLTGLNLRSCNCKLDEECKCNIVQKHPSLVIFIFVVFLIFTIGITEYFLDYRLILSELFKSFDNKEQFFIVFGILAILIGIFYFWFKCKRR